MLFWGEINMKFIISFSLKHKMCKWDIQDQISESSLPLLKREKMWRRHTSWISLPQNGVKSVEYSNSSGQSDRQTDQERHSRALPWGYWLKRKRGTAASVTFHLTHSLWSSSRLYSQKGIPWQYLGDCWEKWLNENCIIPLPHCNISEVRTLQWVPKPTFLKPHFSLKGNTY